jgi:hypothetical protein
MIWYDNKRLCDEWVGSDSDTAALFSLTSFFKESTSARNRATSEWVKRFLVVELLPLTPLTDTLLRFTPIFLLFGDNYNSIITCQE